MDNTNVLVLITITAIIYFFPDYYNDDFDDQEKSKVRRLSEFKPIKQVPVPQASAFFIFSSTNK